MKPDICHFFARLAGQNSQDQPVPVPSAGVTDVHGKPWCFSLEIQTLAFLLKEQVLLLTDTSAQSSRT